MAASIVLLDREKALDSVAEEMETVCLLHEHSYTCCSCTCHIHVFTYM